MYKIGIWSLSKHFQNKVFLSIKNNKKIKINSILKKKKFDKSFRIKKESWFDNENQFFKNPNFDYVYISSINSNHYENCKTALENKVNLDVIFDFGLIPLGNNLQSSIKDSLSVDNFPLVLVQCSNCKHFQLNFSVDPKILYATNYTYLSGIGNSFRKHLKEFCKSVSEW